MHRRASLPARINVLGEHTDYAGGLALPFATHLRLTLNAFSQEEGYDGDATVIELWRAAGGWPARLSVESQIPMGVGMSSSAALCLAVVLCVNGSIKPSEACLEAQRIEHQVLKTPCGLLDQMAMMFAKEGCATLIDFSNLSTQSVLLPVEWIFKLVDSGIHRKLSETSYRSHIGDAIQVAHVETENQRVKSALGASAQELGSLLNQSHASLQKLGVSLTQIDEQVSELQQTTGVFGARMMGGGYGGMILVLVESSEILPDAPCFHPSQGGFVEEFFE
jgi:galactokinase